MFNVATEIIKPSDILSVFDSDDHEKTMIQFVISETAVSRAVSLEQVSDDDKWVFFDTDLGCYKECQSKYEARKELESVVKELSKMKDITLGTVCGLGTQEQEVGVVS